MNTIISGILEHHKLEIELIKLIKEVYNFSSSSIKNELQHFIGELRSDIWAYIEYPYVDKTYRSSYYSYFSTKHRHYERDSIRVTLFSEKITEDNFRNSNLKDGLQKFCLGYFTIRPTHPYLFGRAMISPIAMKNNDYAIALVKTDVLINGAKLKVSAFPYSSQDTETISCAETTVWSIMEYYGNKYPEYCPTLPSEIVEILSKNAYERQLPSHGLTAKQISFALKELGFGVRLYLKDIFLEEFKSLFFHYIDSGIPFAATVQNKEIGHALVVIGDKPPSIQDILTTESVALKLSDQKNLKILDWSLIPREYVAIDDNYPPYRTAKFEKPTEYYYNDTWSDCKITSIIVPLYNKIYLEAIEAKKLALSLLKLNIVISNLTDDELVLRLFLTSSRSFKNKIAFDTAIEANIKELIINIVMPKFIWIMEISDRENCCQHQAKGMIVLDATEANDNASDALLFIGLPNKFIFVKDYSFHSIQIQLSPFPMYKNYDSSRTLVKTVA